MRLASSTIRVTGHFFDYPQNKASKMLWLYNKPGLWVSLNTLMDVSSNFFNTGNYLSLHHITLLEGHLGYTSTSQQAAKRIQRTPRFDRSAPVSWCGADSSPLSQLIQWHAPCLKRREKLGGKKTFSSFINHRSKQPIQWHLARLMLGTLEQSPPPPRAHSASHSHESLWL